MLDRFQGIGGSNSSHVVGQGGMIAPPAATSSVQTFVYAILIPLILCLMCCIVVQCRRVNQRDFRKIPSQ